MREQVIAAVGERDVRRRWERGEDIEPRRETGAIAQRRRKILGTFVREMRVDENAERTARPSPWDGESGTKAANARHGTRDSRATVKRADNLAARPRPPLLRVLDLVSYKVS